MKADVKTVLNNDEISQLSNQQLLAEAKKIKTRRLINASLIGFMMGIIIFSVVKNNLGFFALIPALLVFKLFHNPQQNDIHEAIQKQLKVRNLI